MNEIEELAMLQAEATPDNAVQCKKCDDHSQEIHFLKDVEYQARMVSKLLCNDPSIAPDPTLLDDDIVKLEEYRANAKYKNLPGSMAVNHGA